MFSTGCLEVFIIICMSPITCNLKCKIFNFRMTSNFPYQLFGANLWTLPSASSPTASLGMGEEILNKLTDASGYT